MGEGIRCLPPVLEFYRSKKLSGLNDVHIIEIYEIQQRTCNSNAKLNSTANKVEQDVSTLIRGNKREN